MKQRITSVFLLFMLCMGYAKAQTNVAAVSFTATASTGDAEANLAIDGNPGTRWASDAEDNQSLVIDMGSQRAITGAKIIWETAKAKNFTIDISDNGSDWTTIVTDENTEGGDRTESNYNSWSYTTRYLRVNCIDRLTGWGNSIWELEIYGEFPSASASSEINANSAAKFAIDGNTGGNRWESEHGDADVDFDQWITVDLKQSYVINKVDIYWEGAKAEDYLIQVSDNNADWTTAAAITGNIPANDNHQSHNVSASGRYVRIYCTKRALNAYGYSIWELEIYGTPGTLPVSLTNFTAKAQTNGTVSLNWSTASEQGNDYFLLERSADGKNFSSLTELSSKGSNSNYQYTDNQPYNGNNYYRLTQVDKDGKSKELGIQSVSVSLAKQKSSIYPNPLQGNKLYITLGEKNNNPITVTISNLAGKEVYKGSFNTSDIKIELAELPSGIYIVKAGTQQTFKLYVK